MEEDLANGLRSAEQGNKTNMSCHKGNIVSRSSLIKQGLEKNISDSSKKKIYSILDDVNKLSDVEKLLLYLKLPNGVSGSVETSGSEGIFQRDEHQKALQWLRTHLEEDAGTCVQKQELYDQYREFCDSNKYKIVNQFDFGKLLRQLFPNLKLRHLGQRGQSKTCYGGIKSSVQLKPLTIPKMEIPSEDQTQAGSEYVEEDQRVTQAACELVCEWAQKLHANKQFPGVQQLAEHLISSCVVGTNSTAAFTIIAAAQKEDRKIFTEGNFAVVTPQSGSTDGSSSRTILQPKTHLQLQRTLKGRRMLREQREKMGEQQGEVHPSTNANNKSDKYENMKMAIEMKISANTKKNTNITTPQHILPKCTLASQVFSNNSTVVLPAFPQSGVQQASVQSATTLTAAHMIVPGIPVSSISTGPSVPQPVFVLPSQVMSVDPQKQMVTPHKVSAHTATINSAPLIKTQPTSQIVKTQQMVILSPVSNGGSNATVTFSKEKVSLASRSLSNKSGSLNTMHSSTTSQLATNKQSPLSKQNSRLAMLLTENNDNRIFSKTTQLTKEPSVRAIDVGSKSTKTELAQFPLRHMIPPEQRPSVAVTSVESSIRNILTNSAVNKLTEAGNVRTTLAQQPKGTAILTGSLHPALRQSLSQDTHSVITSQPSTPGTPNSSSNSGSRSPTPSNGGPKSASKTKRKATPLKPRPTSKTVSTLLKETRGYGPQVDNTCFTKDRRPVSQLLKECRQRKTSLDGSPSSAVILTRVSTPVQQADKPMVVHTMTLPGQSGSIQPLSVHFKESSVQPNVASNPSESPQKPMETSDTINSFGAKTQFLEPSDSDCDEKTGVFAGTAVRSEQNVKNISGFTGLPSNSSGTENVPTANSVCSQRLYDEKDPFTCFGKEPILPGSGMMMSLNEEAQDTNNNQGYQTKSENNYSSDDSNGLTINLGSNEQGGNPGYCNLTESMTNQQTEYPETSVNEGQISNNEVGITIGITNMERDALSNYFEPELSSDLADITPSLTMDGQGRDLMGHTGVNSGLNDATSNSLSTSQGLINKALLTEHSNPFMTPPEVQRTVTVASLLGASQNRMVRNSVPRPNSELQHPNSDMFHGQQECLVSRPSTMPPEIYMTNNGALLQNYLMETHPSVSIGGQNSYDSVTYGSGMHIHDHTNVPSHSPSFCSMESAPSTPSSLLSPPEKCPPNSGNVEPTNSFVPIQGSSGSLSLDQVSPIRPMVTLATRKAAMMNNNMHNGHYNSNAHGGGNNFPRFSNPESAINYASSFVPYNMAGGPITEQPQQQQKNPVFLPASSIRPVKRPMTNSQQSGGHKRVRHRSAQDAKSLAKAQAKKAASYNMLTNLLRSGSEYANVSASMGNIQNKANVRQRPCNLPKPLVMDQAGHLSNPQSPFSPEMQDIMTGDAKNVPNPQGYIDLNTGMFRSQSVPVPFLQRSGSEPQELAASAFPYNQCPPGQEDQNSDLSNLLQDKIQDNTVMNRGNPTVSYEYSARRNINNLLQDEGPVAPNSNAVYRSSVRGDHMISGASVRTSQQLALLNHPTIQLALAQRLQRAASYPGDCVPTPPSSQNHTPDFSTELTSIGDSNNTFCLQRVGASTVIDTPDSLDTAPTQDGQEGLKDELVLSGLCEGTDDWHYPAH